MTTPTLFSDVAANSGILQPGKVDGSLYAVKALRSIPVATAGNVKVGMIRLKKGRRVMALNFWTADVDTGSAITVDLGVTYDSSTLSASESVDGFFDGLGTTNHATQRNTIWPVISDAEAFDDGFVAEGDGYITATILDSGAGGTTTLGDFILYATMSDGNAV